MMYYLSVDSVANAVGFSAEWDCNTKCRIEQASCLAETKVSKGQG